MTGFGFIANGRQDVMETETAYPQDAEMRRVSKMRETMKFDSAKYLAECEAEIKHRREHGKSDKTCSGCVRCKRVDLPRTRDKDHSTGWHCLCRDYDAGIFPSDPACEDWWDKEQYEREEREKEERTEAERKRKWAIYADKPPVKLPIVFDGYGNIPMCPVCHEMPYSTEQCHWCGQHFIQDEEITEYSKPKTKKGKCSNCGAEIEIGISRYNGHKHYHCNKCGMSMME
jgi:hypothetical protein